MSVSENSTLFPLRDNEGSELALDNQSNVRDLDVASDEKSPYTDGDFVKIIVGSIHFYAHRTILAKSPELELKPFSKLWGDKANDTITLPNIDENTAHTLIHYLYSEKYVTLKLTDKEADRAESGYKLGTCVYCSAIKYRLPGLAELAQEKIVAYGKDMNILKILNVAREHAFPLLPDDETWFSTYLENTIRAALSQDSTLLGKFAGLMGGNKEADNKFRTVVLNAIVNPQPTPTLLSQAETGISTPAEEDQAKEVSDDGNELSQKADVAEEPQVVDDIPQEPEVEQAPAAEPDPVEIPPADNIIEVEDLKLEEINPTQSAPAQPEPYTDEVGFGASKHYKSQAKKTDNVVEKEPATESKIERPAHVRMDSVVQDTEPVELKQSPATEVTNAAPSDPVEEKAPVIVDGTNGAVASKKKRNKKKKGNA